MDTVKFNCERCGKLMAVLSADKGKSVECPHCHETVTAPAQPPEPSPADPTLGDLPEFHVPSAAEQESIFSPPEATADDLFGSGPVTKLEIPEEPPLPDLQIERPSTGREGEASAEPPTSPGRREPRPPEPAPSGTDFAFAAAEPDAPAPPHEEPAPAAPHAVTEAAPSPLAAAPQAEAELPHADAEPDTTHDIPAPPPRRPQQRGVLGILLLIFLIPYSLVSTAAVAWLLYQRRAAPPASAPGDPLEFLPDPKPGEGGPRRVKHDMPLPEKLKTGLKQPLRVGDLEVTPLAVERTPQDELLLKLQLQNVSRDVAFEPLPQTFLNEGKGRLPGVRPYTYLAVGPGVKDRLYGGGVEYVTTPPGKNGRRFDGLLRPGQEEVVLLRTHRKDSPLVERLAPKGGPLLWRVQVRRGFVRVKGKDVSATAVVGVRFDRSAIRPAAADARRRAPAAESGQAGHFFNTPGNVACINYAVLYNAFLGQ